MKRVQLSTALGWFSIGLGLSELLIPRGVGKTIGLKRNHRMLMRLLGLREIGAGLAILAQPKKPAWMWSRVGGDAIDLALLGAALSMDESRKGRVAAATAAVVGVTALDVVASQKFSRAQNMTRNGKLVTGSRKVEYSVLIGRSPEELYSFWRDFENLPKFMVHLESVTVSDDPRRSHWVAKAPAGKKVEWDAELVDDHKNELIAWRTAPGSEIEQSGRVRFLRAPGNRGTIVQVELRYNPPAGILGVAVAKLFGEEPQQQVEDDLRHFKQLMETGELSTIKGQPAGRAMSTSKKFDRTMPSTLPQAALS
ncbi:MAG: SRPBCC family protein [Verrucomicrobiota bacterium]